MKELLEKLMSKVSPPRLPKMDATAMRRTLHAHDRDCARNAAFNPIAWFGRPGAVVEHPKREEKSVTV